MSVTIKRKYDGQLMEMDAVDCVKCIELEAKLKASEGRKTLQDLTIKELNEVIKMLSGKKAGIKYYTAIGMILANELIQEKYKVSRADAHRLWQYCNKMDIMFEEKSEDE